ncbi:MAG: c-type cytochrome domain-containing protein [Chryseolinea sp.]
MGEQAVKQSPGISVVITFCVGILLLVVPLIHIESVPVFLLFLGRLHPLVLHFPIVLIMLALVVEISRQKFFTQKGDTLLYIFVGAASLSTLLSIAAGYLLNASGEYSGQTITRHLWGGAATGSAMFLAWSTLLYATKNSKFYKLYFILLVFSNVAVIYTSHLGGSVTHGEDYLSEHLDYMMSDSLISEERAEDQLLLFSDMVQPIFEAKCVGCHNAQRSKGGFRMDTYASLFKIGDSGNPGIAQGDTVQSEIEKRVTLPRDHDDHMPPEGKTPLTKEELSLVSFWIKSGAIDTSKVTAAKRNDTIRQTIQKLIPELQRYRVRTSIAKLKNDKTYHALEEVTRSLKMTCKKDSLTDGNLYTISMMFPPVKVTSHVFKELRPFDKTISRVSMASAGLQDDALYYLAEMANVRVLYLQKNALNGSGIIHLAKLSQLEVLNLSFNKIDDKSALDLLKIPSLRTVYLYRTNTSPQVIEALTKYRPELRILLEEGPYF